MKSHGWRSQRNMAVRKASRLQLEHLEDRVLLAVCDFSEGQGCLEVIKDIVPDSDPGRFDLQIDGTTQKDEAGDGDTTGTLVVSADSHTVGETADGETSLTDYRSSISCIDVADPGNVIASSSDAGPLNVTVSEGSDVVCTITNVRRTGTLEVVKDLDPDDDPGLFNLFIQDSGGTTIDSATDAGEGGTTGENTVPVGTYTVGETAGTGTNLSDYSSFILCENANGFIVAGNSGNSATVSVGESDDIVCTISNRHKYGELEVVKDLVPNSDPGRFDLQIDAVTEFDEAGDGDSATKTVSVGNHTVGETADGETNLNDYTSSISCIDISNETLPEVAKSNNAGPLQVPVDDGHHIVCTITNTRTRTEGKLEVIKDVIPSSDPGKFNLSIRQGSTVIDTASNVGDGGSTGEDTLPTGTYSVRETAGSGTSLGNYTTSISCRDGDGTGSVVASGSSTSLNVNVTTGSDIVCVITNTRKTGKLEVVKDIVPDTDPGKFNLFIKSGSTVVDSASNVGDNGTTGENTLNTGSYTVSETGSSTLLGNYTTSIVCRGNNGTGSVVASGSNAGPLSVSVTSGSDIICTITNSRKLPSLWGVDEDDGELFSMVDYTRIPSGPAAAGFVSYGKLMYVTNGGGSIAPIGPDIESFAIDSNGDAYMAIDHDLVRSGGLPTLKAPVLVKFNVNNATTAGPNVVTVVGSIPIPGFHAGGRPDNISGLAFQPGTGTLYALFRVNDAGRDPDHLLIISKTNAALISDLGQIRNNALGLVCDECEELEFDTAGNLFASDDQDDHLYKVDPSNAQITALVDNNELGGTGQTRVKIEAMVWDPATGKFLSFDDQFDKFIGLTLGNGSNPSLGKISGLTDVEGLAFYSNSSTRAGVTAAAVTDVLLTQSTKLTTSSSSPNVVSTSSNGKLATNGTRRHHRRRNGPAIFSESLVPANRQQASQAIDAILADKLPGDFDRVFV